MLALAETQKLVAAAHSCDVASFAARCAARCAATGQLCRLLEGGRARVGEGWG